MFVKDLLQNVKLFLIIVFICLILPLYGGEKERIVAKNCNFVDRVELNGFINDEIVVSNGIFFIVIEKDQAALYIIAEREDLLKKNYFGWEKFLFYCQPGFKEVYKNVQLEE